MNETALYPKGRTPVRMSKRLTHFLATLFLLSSPVYAEDSDWIVSLYQCQCFTGQRPECLKDMEARSHFRPEAVFIPVAGHYKEAADEKLKAINKAVIILEMHLEISAKTSQTEKQVCLIPKIGDLRSARKYALDERPKLSVDNIQSSAIIEALMRLAEQVYSKAYEECLKPEGNATAGRYERSLPDPAQCQESITAKE